MTSVRPYLTMAAALAVIVLALVQANGGSSSLLSGDGDASGFSRPTAGAGGPSSSGSGQANGGGPSPTGPSSVSGPGPVGAAPLSGQDSSGGDAAGGGAGGPASTADYPGLGTPEALANPECDPNTGRIKFPSAYAPPCVRPWPEGADNGGATGQGVTGEEIRVAVLLPPDSNSRDDEAMKAQILDTLDIFESHYELWGRTLAVKFHKASGDDEVAQRADAVEVFNRYKPFAVFHGGQTPFPVWAAELAARGVISVAMAEPWEGSAQQPGFRWGSGSMDDRLTWSHAVEYTAKRLQGDPARWAGDAAYQTATRKIGAIHPDSWDRKFMGDEAARWGLRLAAQVAYPDGDVVATQNRASTLISRLKDAGVTTVIAATDIFANVVLTGEASNQLWFPEWVVTGWGNQDTAVASRLADQRQWRQAFGPGPVQPLVPNEHYDLLVMHEWHHGRPPENQAVHGQTRLAAHVLMTGLHVTGPHLTSERFRDARFAAPPTGGVWCGCASTTGVSYGRHAGVPWDDYSSFDDMTEKWWDPDTVGTDEIGLTGPGVYWKVDGGRRYVSGQWPSSPPRVFTQEGAVERFDKPPPGEELPRYPHEPH